MLATKHRPHQAAKQSSKAQQNGRETAYSSNVIKRHSIAAATMHLVMVSHYRDRCHCRGPAIHCPLHCERIGLHCRTTQQERTPCVKLKRQSATDLPLVSVHGLQAHRRTDRLGNLCILESDERV